MTGQEQVQRTTYPIVGPLGKFTLRMLAVVLAGQAIAVFFGAQVARGLAIAEGNPGLGQRWLWIGIGISLLAVLAAGLMRRGVGLPAGWLVQLLTWASVLVVPAMAFVGIIFTGLWVLCLRKGFEIDTRLVS